MAIGTDTFKNFIPTLWSARLLAALDKNLVYEQLVNTDYEGEIKSFGDTVKINSVGEITIKEYTGTDIDAPEELSSTQTTLVIDKAKYFNFAVKDVAQAQANIDLMDKSMERAGYALALHIDTAISSLANSNKLINKKGEASKSGAVAINVKNAYDVLVDLDVAMDEANLPKAGRKIILPYWYIGMLRKDVRFIDNFNVLGNGIIEGAMVGNLQLLTSNNVAKREDSGTDVYSALAGTVGGISFAKQVVETEAYRPEKNFSDAVKGLLVYGLEIIDPRQIVVFNFKKADDAV